MRAAPPVSVRCVGGLSWRCTQAVLPGLAAAVFVFWGLGRAESPALVMAVASAAAALLATAIAWQRAAPRPATLAWDGGRWSVDGTAGALDVMVDLQDWLLLRLRPAAGGASRWVAVSATDAGGALHGLRAAAYAAVADDSPAAPAGRAARGPGID
jgi:hypothetical protein